jgi:hypothetical protein
MGIPISGTDAAPGTPPAGDMANGVVSGTFTATGASQAYCFFGPFNISVWGTFSGTVLVQRSFDGGTTWLTRLDTPVGSGSFTAPATFALSEPEQGVSYQLECSVFTSGTVNYRMSATGGAATAWGASLAPR